MKIKKMTDEQALEVFTELLETRIQLGTAYVPDPDTGVLLAQVLIITCGDLKIQSEPEPLFVPLMPVVPEGEITN